MANTPVIIHPTLTSAVGPYYALFPVEPTPSSSAANWIMTGKRNDLKTASVKELLTAIAGAASSGGSVLICGHGNNQGLSFAIGDAKSEIHLEYDPMQAIRRNQEGKATDDQTAQLLKLNAAGYKELKALIVTVQQLSLDRVDVRACSTGQNDVAMSALQVFFNCDTFCAPKMLDSFGEIGFQPFARNAGDFDTWVKNHPNAQVSGGSPDRFALSQDMTKGINTEAMAESKKGAKDWADSHLPAGGNFTGANSLRYHALTNMKSAMYYAGEPQFRAELVEAKKGHEPSRKIDLNQGLQLTP
jgi:hypothetical protein